MASIPDLYRTHCLERIQANAIVCLIAEKSGRDSAWIGIRFARRGDENVGRVEYQPRPKSWSETLIKIFQKLTKKKASHEN